MQIDQINIFVAMNLEKERYKVNQSDFLTEKLLTFANSGSKVFCFPLLEPSYLKQ